MDVNIRKLELLLAVIAVYAVTLLVPFQTAFACTPGFPDLWWYSERVEFIESNAPSDVWFTWQEVFRRTVVEYELTGPLRIEFEGKRRAVANGASITASPHSLVVQGKYPYPIENRNIESEDRPENFPVPDPQIVELTFIRRNTPFQASFLVYYVPNEGYITESELGDPCTEIYIWTVVIVIGLVLGGLVMSALTGILVVRGIRWTLSRWRT